jgi:hypothetical protein
MKAAKLRGSQHHSFPVGAFSLDDLSNVRPSIGWFMPTVNFDPIE